VLVLHNLAMACLAAGNAPYAGAILTEGLEYSLEIGNHWYVAYCLEGFGCLCVAQEHYSDAARLFGLAEAIRDQVHAPIPPAGAGMYEPFLSACRNSLPPEEHDGFWKEGRAWQVDAARTRVLELLA